MTLWKSRHLYTAAAFRALGRKPVRVAVEDDGQIAFFFDNTDGQCGPLDYGYRHGTLPNVQPREMIEALIQTRQSMFDARKG